VVAAAAADGVGVEAPARGSTFVPEQATSTMAASAAAPAGRARPTA